MITYCVSFVIENNEYWMFLIAFPPIFHFMNLKVSSWFVAKKATVALFREKDSYNNFLIGVP